MASRKEQKEQARADRLAAEQAAAVQAARTRRIQLIAGVVVIAVVVIVVAIAISASGGSSGGKVVAGKQGQKLYAQVNQTIGGIPQSGTTLGNPSAKVTLTYFGDLECPICKAFELGQNEGGVVGGLPEFIQKQVKTGNAKLVYRSFCTATCGHNGQQVFNTQQVAAYAAGKQNHFWDYAELFYLQQGDETTSYVTPTFLKGLAAQIPTLNQSKWQTDRGDPSLLAQVSADSTQAGKDGVQGTPTLLATGPKGTEAIGSGVLSYDQLVSGIKAVS